MLFGFTFLGDVFVFAAGFAVCWYFKDPLTKLFVGTETFAKNLETKAAAVKAAVKS